MPKAWFNTGKILKSLGKPFLATQVEEPSTLSASGFQPINLTVDSDVFVVGYPKSGNTWVQNLIAGLLFGIDTRFLTDRLTQLLVPNVHGVGFYKRLLDFTCFKSHELPKPEYRRVIYLVRDGRDAMVSYYHMLNAVSDEPISFSQLVVDGKGVFPCKWHEHIETWNENPFGAEMMFLRYEDLHTDPYAEMNRICGFLDIDRDEQTIKRCVQGNAFSSMQLKEDRFGWDNESWTVDKRFVRRGVVGSYKDEMPDDLRIAFEQESKSQLLEFGYEVSDRVGSVI